MSIYCESFGREMFIVGQKYLHNGRKKCKSRITFTFASKSTLKLIITITIFALINPSLSSISRYSKSSWNKWDIKCLSALDPALYICQGITWCIITYCNIDSILWQNRPQQVKSQANIVVIFCGFKVKENCKQIQSLTLHLSTSTFEQRTKYSVTKTQEKKS